MSVLPFSQNCSTKYIFSSITFFHPFRRFSFYPHHCCRFIIKLIHIKTVPFRQQTVHLHQNQLLCLNGTFTQKFYHPLKSAFIVHDREQNFVPNLLNPLEPLLFRHYRFLRHLSDLWNDQVVNLAELVHNRWMLKLQQMLNKLPNRQEVLVHGGKEQPLKAGIVLDYFFNLKILRFFRNKA